MPSARVPLALSIAVTLTGCGTLDDVLEEAQLALDGNQAAVACVEATYLGGIVVTSVRSEDPDLAAATGELPDDLSPRDCASWIPDETDTRRVRVKFDGCNGPFGLKKVRGSLVARFSAAEDGSLRARVTSEELRAGSRPIDVDAIFDIAIVGLVRTVRWRARWASLAKGGGPLRQSSELSVVIDEDCRAFRGTAESDVDDRDLVTAVSQVTICSDEKGRDQCPEGIMIHHAQEPPRRVTVTFDGTKRVSVDGDRTDPALLELDCRARKKDMN